jgi:hypothetical protein
LTKTKTEMENLLADPDVGKPESEEATARR